MPMTGNPEQLRQEIDRTREQLAEALEALGERVSPKQVVHRVKDGVEDRMEAIGDRVSPRRILERGTSKLRSGGDQIMSAVTRSESSGHEGTSLNGSHDDDVREQASNLLRKVRRMPVAASDRAGAASDEVRYRAQETSSKVRDMAESNPLVTGAVVLGAGIAVGLAIRPTDGERQAARRLKGRIDPLRDKALDVGRSVAGELQSGAQASLGKVKGRAAEAVFDQVKEKAQDVVGEVKGQARAATRQVAGKARSASRSRSTGSTGSQRSPASRSSAARSSAARSSAARSSAARSSAARSPGSRSSGSRSSASRSSASRPATGTRSRSTSSARRPAARA